MKCSVLHMGRWASALLVLMLVFASCGKEELVAPASAAANGASKNTTVPGTTGPVEPGSGAIVNPKSGDSIQGEGTGISDDGDDISGSERNRKKTS